MLYTSALKKQAFCPEVDTNSMRELFSDTESQDSAPTSPHNWTPPLAALLSTTTPSAAGCTTTSRSKTAKRERPSASSGRGITNSRPLPSNDADTRTIVVSEARTTGVESLISCALNVPPPGPGPACSRMVIRLSMLARVPAVAAAYTFEPEGHSTATPSEALATVTFPPLFAVALTTS